MLSLWPYSVKRGQQTGQLVTGLPIYTKMARFIMHISEEGIIKYITHIRIGYISEIRVHQMCLPLPIPDFFGLVSGLLHGFDIYLMLCWGRPHRTRMHLRVTRPDLATWLHFPVCTKSRGIHMHTCLEWNHGKKQFRVMYLHTVEVARYLIS